MLLNIGIILRVRDVWVRGLLFKSRFGAGIIDSTRITIAMKIIVPIQEFSFRKYTNFYLYDKEATLKVFQI